jgi:Protein of unknown function (DUF2510)
MTHAGPGNAGWYPDPAGRFDDRYWDGNQWTAAVKRGEQVESDPDSVLAEFPTSTAATSAAPTTSQPPPGGGPPSGQMVTPPPWPRGPGGAGDRQTSLPLAQAQREIVRILPLAGILVKGEQPGQVQAAVPVKGEPNVATVVILCLLCLIPGLIYWAVSSRVRMEPVVVYLAPSHGTTTVTVQAALGARQAVLNALGALPW